MREFGHSLLIALVSAFLGTQFIVRAYAEAAPNFIKAELGATKNAPLGDDQLMVQFTGAGGVYITTRDLALLADPFFSNPGLGDLVLLSDLVVDETMIDRWLPPTENVKAVIVGHGHYDHLMDVPSVLERLPEMAKVYASKTSSHMIASKVPASRRVALNSVMASSAQRGEWVMVHPRVRILAIESEHSPHMAGMVFASDLIHADAPSLPGDALDWQSGTTLSYVIDFLKEEGGDSLFRVFYQSSSSGFPVGAPPQWLIDDGVPFDLAVICMANFDKVDNYPSGVLSQLKPAHVLLTHWEVFWERYLPNEASVLPGLSIESFLAKARKALPKGTPIYLPQRGASITLQK